MNPTIFGVGINDADYMVSPRTGAKRIQCPFYSRWRDMLMRCYSEKYQIKRPTYAGCAVCNEWLTFSNFKKWMQSQNWKGLHLDKDILIDGNKTYSPEACAFVSLETNNFLLDMKKWTDTGLVGANKTSNGKRLRGRCRNPFTGKSEHLGTFDCPVDAHNAWIKRKTELARMLAEKEVDQRIKSALLSMEFS